MGLFPGVPIADAREWARGLNEQVEIGLDPRIVQREEKVRNTMTVAKAHTLCMIAVRDGRSSRAKRANKPRTIKDKLAIYISGARTMPRPPFGMSNFTLIDVAEGEEAVLGLAGQFWRLDYGQDIIADASAFLRFEAAGAAKLAPNYAVEPLDGQRTRLTTETRVYCIDAQARRHFTPYWYVIRLVSGLIRRRMLANIKREATTPNPE